MCKTINGLTVLMNNINEKLIHGKRLLGSKSRKNQRNPLNMLLYTDAVFGCFKRENKLPFFKTENFWSSRVTIAQRSQKGKTEAELPERMWAVLSIRSLSFFSPQISVYFIFKVNNILTERNREEGQTFSLKETFLQ